MRRRTGPVLVGILVILSSGCRPAITSSQRAEFQSIERDFTSANRPSEFLGLAQRYERLINAGLKSGGLLYNQGNAYLNAGQRGRAIACYEQAERYRPRDRFLRANLALARGDLPIRPADLSKRVIFWSEWISEYEQFLLALSAVILCVLLQQIGRWRGGIWQASVPASICLAFILMMAAGWSCWTHRSLQRGVLVEPDVVARKGSAPSYEPAFEEPLPEGLPFTVVNRRSDWILGEFSGGKTGWVHSRDSIVY